MPLPEQPATSYWTVWAAQPLLGRWGGTCERRDELASAAPVPIASTGGRPAGEGLAPVADAFVTRNLLDVAQPRAVHEGTAGGMWFLEGG